MWKGSLRVVESNMHQWLRIMSSRHITQNSFLAQGQFNRGRRRQVWQRWETPLPIVRVEGPSGVGDVGRTTGRIPDKRATGLPGYIPGFSPSQTEGPRQRSSGRNITSSVGLFHDISLKLSIVYGQICFYYYNSI